MGISCSCVCVWVQPVRGAPQRRWTYGRENLCGLVHMACTLHTGSPPTARGTGLAGLTAGIRSAISSPPCACSQLAAGL